ncbi:MAG TPA: hypothetical protein VL026_09295 [Rhizomicrobium sp.]|nr:hypothetical protein [Rhizomicrobium sp.]
MSIPLLQGRRSLWKILQAPVWIALVTAGGLAAALLGDGGMHMLSWALLALPVVLVLRALALRPAPQPFIPPN